MVLQEGKDTCHGSEIKVTEGEGYANTVRSWDEK